MVTSYNEGAERLIETDGHDLGLIADSPGVNYLKSKNCQLYSVGNLGERFYGLAFKRSRSSSAKVAQLSTKILELQESGMLPLFISTWFGNDKCHKKVYMTCISTYSNVSI